MKASDYIVQFLIDHQITDVFGYPGGMVTHLMDSLDRYSEQIHAHVNYHEQACAMAACGWAEITGLPGVAFATSGPGATNLVTGIACAYFDSLPCIFITGQVNTYEQKGSLGVRQRGFQETDIVSIVRPVTKEALMVTDAADLPRVLDHAFHVAMTGRPGPVLIDIPMNVTRGEISDSDVMQHAQRTVDRDANADQIAAEILQKIAAAKRPVILAGHGINISGTRREFLQFVQNMGIPVITSMIAVDTAPSNLPCSFGMIGAYGTRWGNYIVNHCDLLLTLGSRLDCRQAGVHREWFAPDATILRVDIDPGEAENITHDNEKQLIISLQSLLPALLHQMGKPSAAHEEWLRQCQEIRQVYLTADAVEPGNAAAAQLGAILEENSVVTTDVGQNQVWIAQSMPIKNGQRVLFSGGHGAMGYSLPAAIGASLADRSRNVYCVLGDGGLQMNIQELHTVVRENLPIKVILLNNRALGMIHHFQEMYFSSNYAMTDASKGYSTPDFVRIAEAYGLPALRIAAGEDLRAALQQPGPAFLEVVLPDTTHVFPKLGLNKPIDQQEPPLPAEISERVSKILGVHT